MGNNAYPSKQKFLINNRSLRYLIDKVFIIVLMLAMALNIVMLSNFYLINYPTKIDAASSSSIKPSPKLTEQLTNNALKQIQQLLAEKYHRTTPESKLSSSLLFAIKQADQQALANQIKSNIATLRSVNRWHSNDLIEIDIKGLITRSLLNTIKIDGGTIIDSVPVYRSLRAKLPLKNIIKIAQLPQIKNIQLAINSSKEQSLLKSSSTNKKSFSQINLKQSLPNSLNTKSFKSPELLKSLTPQAIDISAGVIAHRVDIARSRFGVTGQAVKIGLLADSIDLNILADLQANGDLPAVTILKDQQGNGRSTGTAMLEIIHDLAPDAELFFATSANGAASFARNIIDLRRAGCDIILDNTTYLDESPFQDGLIAQAVNTVTADGAIYFAAAGDNGNFNNSSSSVYEGDFIGATNAPLLIDGTINLFDGIVGNPVTGDNNLNGPVGENVTLFWSDPLGQSNNDYDLFVLDASLNNVLDSSTNIQNGDDDPFEMLGPVFTGDRIVIVKKNGAADRFLHLEINSTTNLNNSSLLFINSAGRMRGHSCATDAISVAAVDVNSANNGPFTGGINNPVEPFSSDGSRRLFYRADGSELNPGSGFLSTGGMILSKPDISAADGVMTATPDINGRFNPFFGTSAAVAHAAAIAALVKSFKLDLKPTQIRAALINGALDIETPGSDQLSGVGIVVADGAIDAISAAKPFLIIGDVSATLDGHVNVPLINIGNANALGINAQLISNTPNVNILSNSSPYLDIRPNSSTTNNLPFIININALTPCAINLSLKVTFLDNINSQAVNTQVINFTAVLGKQNSTTFSYIRPSIPIPDNDLNGVDVPLTVQGLNSPIVKLNLRFDGTSCSSNVSDNSANDNNVGLEHSFIGDLVIKLTSPSGTTVTLVDRNGGDGNNFCNTLFDDSAPTSIATITANDAPFSNRFRSINPLSRFNGEDANGTWMLHISDLSEGDTGNLRAFSLIIGTAGCSTILPSTLTTFSPTMGIAGTPVMIKGTNLDNIIKVTFNGVNANFIIVSPTLIIANVPRGAQSGSIQLISALATVSSTTSFTIIAGNVTINNAKFVRSRLTIQGIGFSLPGLSIDINGQDITDRIKKLSDDTIILKGDLKRLGLIRGDNRITISVGGAISNTFVLNILQ